MISQWSIITNISNITDPVDKLSKLVNTLKQSEVLQAIIVPVTGIILTSPE